jgi:hypothetical protein
MSREKRPHDAVHALAAHALELREVEAAAAVLAVFARRAFNGLADVTPDDAATLRRMLGTGGGTIVTSTRRVVAAASEAAEKLRGALETIERLARP